MCLHIFSFAQSKNAAWRREVQTRTSGAIHLVGQWALHFCTCGFDIRKIISPLLTQLLDTFWKSLEGGHT